MSPAGRLALPLISNSQPVPTKERGAYFCMVVIGVGYMFPICAVWAAFDYWKFLFDSSPSNQSSSLIEFELNAVYQLGSVSTVLILSVLPGEGASVPKRVYFGFFGQFLTLAFLLSVRYWHTTITVESLRFCLLCSTVVLSVVTGVLDSAILSLNSQYSSSMQEAMQIGIGCSIFVSVFYRIVTKAVGHTAESSATAFFAVSLVTVLACVSAFSTLLRLPVSARVMKKLGWGSSELEMATGNFQDACEPELSPHESSYYSPLEGDEQGQILGRGTISRSSGSDRPSSLEEEWRDTTSKCLRPPLPSLSYVLVKSWKNELVVFLQFALCAFGYPAMITAIPSVAPFKEHWFQTIQLGVFAVFDIISRFCMRWRLGLTPENVGWTVLLRAAVAYLLINAVYRQSQSDFYSTLIVAAFGLTNGYLISLSLVFVNELKNMSKSELFVLGRFSAFAVNFGLCVGGAISFLFARFFGSAECQSL